MIQEKKRPQKATPNNLDKFKDDDLSPKGRTQHIVETDWPTKEAIPASKKRKIKKMQKGQLP